MANIITRIVDNTNILPPQMTTDLFNMVRGESALAKLSGQTPIPFNGIEEMAFSLDGEASIVGEGEAKVNGGGAVAPVIIRPVKFEYGLRVSDEFLYGTEEYRMNVMRTFLEGASRKFARGFDIAAMHGVNPKSGTASAVVGTNHFDAKVTNTVTYSASAPDANINTAISQIETAGVMATGIAMSPAMKGAVAGLTVGTGGALKYPDFAWGNAPETLGGTRLAVNPTVAVGGKDHAIVGDFSAFRWGYAKDIALDVIEYGNPDNDATAGDLKGHNQVYLRAEAYIGWGILAPAFFSRVITE